MIRIFPMVILILLLNAEVSGQKQQLTQNVRGNIVDSETRATLPGANVRVISDTVNSIGAATDIDGNFRLENVPVGKQTLRITFIGYEEKTLDVEVTSGKEVVLTIEVEESASTLGEIEVTASERGEVANEMAVVSARTFDVSETERYAGSRGDPARMASNFAGVQGADDSRNDIVVRGNSPLGVLYKMEGFDIPNPNHFSIAGSSGGPVSILNNKVLSNSDFFTSAFPAEYGNSTAAVFDLKMRNGNNEKREFSGQLGFLGVELAAEGPFSKESNASFLGVYRYSTVSIFSLLGIDIGTDAVPQYQDLSFKLNFPMKDGGNLSFFGIGGTSSIAIKISDQVKPANDFYGEDDRDQYFSTRMGVTGVSYLKTIKKSTFMRAGIGLSNEQQQSQHDYIIRHLDADSIYVVDSLYLLQQYRFRIDKLSAVVSFNTKISKNHVVKYGMNAHLMKFSMVDSVLNDFHTSFISRWNSTEYGTLAQVFFQWKWKASEKFTLTSGIFSQFFSVSNSFSPAEPRIGMRYQINPKNSVNFGAGLHSQTQPYYTYFYQPEDTAGNQLMYNKDMDFTRSFHSVIGYDRSFSPTMRMKIETYYQYLFDVPVTIVPSAFSLTNMGSGFVRFFPTELENTGTGRNYGVELTVEKFFNKSFFFLLTGSVFDAKYTGSDGVERNTDYNGQYAANILAGKEFKLGKNSGFSIGTKFTTAGGKWYGYVDSAATALQKDLVFLDEGFNTRQFRPYYRLDFKVNFKINGKKTTHEIALDLVNVLGVQNILGLSFDPNSPDLFRENYQLGFLPIFYYRVDF